MSESLKVTATLIPVGRELHAKPGDRLLIVAEVCVGIYTGQPPAQPGTAPKRSHKPRPKPPALPSPAKLDTAPAKLDTAPEAAPGKVLPPTYDPEQTPDIAFDIAAMQRRMLDVIRAAPGIKTTDILDAIGFARSSPHRWRGSQALKLLQRDGRLRSELVHPTQQKHGMRYWPVENGQAGH